MSFLRPTMFSEPSSFMDPMSLDLEGRDRKTDPVWYQRSRPNNSLVEQHCFQTSGSSLYEETRILE